jgi:hypothetical protein
MPLRLPIWGHHERLNYRQKKIPHNTGFSALVEDLFEDS